MEAMGLITPIKAWEPLAEPAIGNKTQDENKGAALFRDVFDNVVEQVYTTQGDVGNKLYLLATGRLDDAHSLPIAQAKAGLSLDVLISLRNKAMESYNELLKMSI